MKLQLVKFKCATCKSEFEVGAIKMGSYGDFLLRSISGAEIAYLNALEDKAYAEVDCLLKENSRVSRKSPNVLADILRKNFGVIACDRDSKGDPFQIGAYPKCTSCGNQNMEYWEVIEPAKFIDKHVSPVTHNEWNGLSKADKEERVDKTLSSLGY